MYKKNAIKKERFLNWVFKKKKTPRWEIGSYPPYVLIIFK